MLKSRIRKKAVDAERAIRLLAEMTRSIEALSDDDLLDLADIFAGDADSVLSKIAAAEMRKREITL